MEDEAVEYQNLESEVKFLLELRNMTEWRLWPDQTYIHWGYISSPPTGLNKDLEHKDWPGKKVTIDFPIFYLVKSSENILLFYLHFT